MGALVNGICKCYSQGGSAATTTSSAATTTTAGGGAPAVGATAAGAWDGTAPFTCGGNDTAVLNGVTAVIASGPAITAKANCSLTCNGCTINTDKGIAASGNARVTLAGGALTASDTAIEASDNARVVIDGTKVAGKAHARGNAKVMGVPTTN
jgi:hypothetical protein